MGAVVLCVCGVLCMDEMERAASLPVGRHCCRVVAASLPGHEALLPSGECACYWQGECASLCRDVIRCRCRRCACGSM